MTLLGIHRSLPGDGGSGQPPVAWLGELAGDHVLWGAKEPVADDHLEINRQPGADVEEPGDGLGGGGPRPEEAVGVEDQDGEGQADEVLPDTGDLPHSLSDQIRVPLVLVYEFRYDGAAGCLPLILHLVLQKGHHAPALLRRSLVVNIRQPGGVNGEVRRQKVLDDQEVPVLGGVPQWAAVVLPGAIGVDPGI